MFRRIRVHGHSMLPTFAEGDVLWSNRFVYLFRAPKKGEVVVVDHPSKPLRLIKRVTGVPGDVVAGRSLGPEEYFVSGDNPRASTDSTAFGTVARRSIVGYVRTPARNG